jgi:hypothetical protein
MSGLLTRKNQLPRTAVAPRILWLLTRQKRRDRDTPLGAHRNFHPKAGLPGLRHFWAPENVQCALIAAAGPPAAARMNARQEAVYVALEE